MKKQGANNKTKNRRDLFTPTPEPQENVASYHLSAPQQTNPATDTYLIANTPRHLSPTTLAPPMSSTSTPETLRVPSHLSPSFPLALSLEGKRAPSSIAHKEHIPSAADHSVLAAQHAAPVPNIRVSFL